MPYESSAQNVEALTDREYTILNLIAQGLATQEIADSLFLSRNTVKWYTGRIFGKLHVKRRTQAISYARTHSLLQDVTPSSAPVPYFTEPPTPLIGRDDELATINHILDATEVRLVTIVGVGGIGKTRLALAVATRRQNRQVPVGFVSLESASTVEDIVIAVASSANIVFGGQQDLKTQLMTNLSVRPLLLVLDNFEHLLGAAPLVIEILEHAPKVKILATSRERLNLHGETVFPLRGLDYPSEQQKPLDYSAVRLFAQSARRTSYDFTLTRDEMSHIVDICRLVDGLPLAVEMAATWTDILTLSEIVTEIEHGLNILRTEMRDVPERHRSMRAVFEHSWKLLTVDERTALAKMAVFRGGFDRAAAEAVAGVTLFKLSTLVDKSLVMRTGPDRYTLHELLRQFAEEKLRNDLEGYSNTLDSHCHYYGTLLLRHEDETKADLAKVTAGFFMHRVNADNILAGWRRAVEQPCIEEIGLYAYSMSLFFIGQGLFTVAEQTYKRALQQIDVYSERVSASHRVRVLTHYGWFCCRIANYVEARRYLEEGLALGEPLEATHPADVSLLLCFLGYAIKGTGDLELGAQYIRRALDLCRTHRFDFGEWVCLTTLAEVESSRENYQSAMQFSQIALEMAQKNSYLIGELYCLPIMACNSCALGDDQQACSLLRQALVMNREFVIIDPFFLVVVGCIMLEMHWSGPEAALNTLAILLHHPQIGENSRFRGNLLLATLRLTLPQKQIDVVLKQAEQGTLSSQYFEPNFTVNARLVEHLLAVLDKECSRHLTSIV